MFGDALSEGLRKALQRLLGHRASFSPEGMRSRPSFVTESFKMVVHESGHAIAAWCSTYTARVERISIDEPGGGIVLRSEFKDLGPDLRWSRMVIDLAGIAAEGLVIGNIDCGPATTDLTQAKQTAEEIAALGPKVARDVPWHTAFVDETKLDISRMFQGHMDPIVRGILNVSYRQARRIVRLHHTAFERTIDAVMAKRVLQGAELDAVLDPKFGFLCKRMRPVFVLPAV